MNNVKAELKKVRAELAALKSANRNGLRFKIGAKGGASVYGLGRFPVTLYQEQWVKLLAEKDNLLAFLKSNARDLKAKDENVKKSK